MSQWNAAVQNYHKTFAQRQEGAHTQYGEFILQQREVDENRLPFARGK